MKSMKKYFFLLFLFSIIHPTFSQTETSWMRYVDRNILQRVMNIEYSHPKGFIGDSASIICLYNPLFTSCRNISLISEDKSFIACYSIFNPVSKEDSAKFYAGSKVNVLDMGHVRQVEHIVKQSFGKNANWKDFVHYFPSDEAKNRFNADTAFSVTILLDKEKTKYYENSYSHCTVLFLQKKGRGYVSIWCVYNEKSINNVDTFISAIEGTLRYREGEPELKRFDGGDEIVIVEGYGTQKKSDKVM